MNGKDPSWSLATVHRLKFEPNTVSIRFNYRKALIKLCSFRLENFEWRVVLKVSRELNGSLYKLAMLALGKWRAFKWLYS